MKIPIEVMGHKGTIESIKPQLADGVWYKEDYLIVWLNFQDDNIASTISFAVDLPLSVQGSSATTLIEQITERAEEEAIRIVDADLEQQSRRKHQESRKLELQSIASALEGVLELSQGEHRKGR